MTTNYYKLYRFNKDDEPTWKAAVDGIHQGLLTLEKEIVKRGTLFFGGNILLFTSLNICNINKKIFRK